VAAQDPATSRGMTLPVLITTALNPPGGVPHLKMGGGARRTVATRSAVYFWASQKVERIVIADATGTICLADEDVALLAAMGCTVEQLSFQQDNELVRLKGKGHAEGQLIAFALRESRLLAGASGFFKCTGKVFCRNYPEIASLAARNGIEHLFWMGGFSGIEVSMVDVRFFLTTPDFFSQAVLPGYANADDRSVMVETAINQALSPLLKSGSFIRPRLTGFSGGFDGQYPDVSLGDLDYRFPCLIGTRPPAA
jgi:hypothetical protein